MRWFIGDIHGCREELEELLETIQRVDSRPQLFATGDVIGKGPDPIGALRLVERERISAVRGNHEAHLLRGVEKGVEKMSTPQRKAFAGLEPEWERCVEQIEEWPLYRELPDIDLVHAGLEPGKLALCEMDERILLTIRTWDGVGELLWNKEDPPWFRVVEWPKKVVFGHWAYQMPPTPPGFFGLDSGCVYGGWLTAWCAEEDRIVRVLARRQWVKGQK